MPTCATSSPAVKVRIVMSLLSQALYSYRLRRLPAERKQVGSSTVNVLSCGRLARTQPRCRRDAYTTRKAIRLWEPGMSDKLIATRVAGLRPTTINRVMAEVRQLQQEGHSLISLMRGQPDSPTPAHIVEAAQ